jgi:amino acid adenylation domain-containing protein
MSEYVDYDPFAGGEISSSHETTEAQKELWLAAQLGHGANCSYNLTVRLDFSENLDAERFKSAMERTASRHASLRMSFSKDGAYFHVAEQPIMDFETVSGSENGVIERLVAAEADTPFNLADGPLWRCKFIDAEPGTTVLLTTHHIAADGWSTGLILEDLATEYAGRPDESDKLPSQFTDYTRWLKSESVVTQTAVDLKYWQDRFTSYTSSPSVPSRHDRSSTRDFQCRFLSHEFRKDCLEQVNQFAKANKVTLTTLLTTAFSAYLSRVSGANEIVLGIPTAGQLDSGMTDLVGHCVNTLPLRTSVDAQMAFSDMLAATKSTMLDDFDHRKVTFGTLLKSTGALREQLDDPLVPVIFNVEPGDFKLSFADIHPKISFLPRKYDNFDASFNCAITSKGLTVDLHFNATLYSDRDMQARLDEFERFLVAVTGSSSSAPMISVPIISHHDNELLDRFNDTDATYRDIASLPDLVAQHAAENPEQAAFIYHDSELSYRQLHERSNVVASALSLNGVSKGDLVAIVVPRSLEMVLALLGTFKVGAAYLPIDSELPATRIDYIRENAGAKAVISSNCSAERIGQAKIKPMVIEQILDTEQTGFEIVPVERDQVAYVIYTSGSTGEPKGVEVTHGSLWNLLNTLQAEPGFTTSDRFVGLTTLSFDIAVLEIWLPLFLGGSSVIIDKRDSQDGRVISRIVEEQGVTVVQATPSSWNLLLASKWEGNKKIKAIAGGEPLRPELIDQLLPRVAELWNGYGPTEATVYTLFRKIEGTEEIVPVGTPVANTKVHIIGESGALVPPGVVGEMCITGDCLARGYRNQPELTSDKFRFHESLQAIAYHTGDLGYIDPESAEMFCLGRVDDQVKLRGYRIELGEISSTFARIYSVDQAVALLVSDGGSDRIALAYRMVDGNEIDDALAREALREFLPDYMVPTRYLGVDEFSITPNGKIDKRALLSRLAKASTRAERGEADVPAEEEHSEFQELVIEVMEQTLRTDNLSLGDNFFDIGGHSLLAMNTVIQLGDLLDIEIDLSLIFDYPVIGDFSERVEALLIEDISA